MQTEREQRPVIDRRDTVRIFRARFLEALERAGLSRSALARQTGIDRSTLSQLLSLDNGRLPRADTVAAIASVLKVSLDWLLGLSHEARLGADVLQESLHFTPSAQTPVDENLARWHMEAAGYKIRYVPATLPDLIKTEEVMRFEFHDYAARSADQAIAASHGRLAYTRLPDTDMEICMPRQSLEAFARGEVMWTGLDRAVRTAQLVEMAAIADELYPSLRINLFDAMTHYSAPYTIFGPARAAVYLGQMYFVFNTTPHIRVLMNHFDGLVRAATVPATETVSFLRELAAEIANG